VTRRNDERRARPSRIALLRAALPALALIVAAACSSGGATPAPTMTPTAALPSPAFTPVEIVHESPSPLLAASPSSSSAATPVAAPPRPPAIPPAARPDGAVDDAVSDDVEGFDAGASVPIASNPASVSVPSTTPEPPARPFAMNLYHQGDWVGQYTLTWRVGASIQMMVNIAEPGQDRTRPTQAKYMLVAQGGKKLTSRGASAWGWAAALTDVGVGQYSVSYASTFQDALRDAARAMRLTRLPVGLLVWGGKHAWVMTGFTSIGDPLVNSSFRVTAVRVLDPLYPRPNSDLGPSPAPAALLKPSTLDNYFVGWSWWSRHPRTGSSSATAFTPPSSSSSFESWRLVLPTGRL
jgi:hypothetical protein